MSNACIFDLDGTLIDSQSKIQNDVICAMKRLGVDISKEDTKGNWYDLAKTYGISEQEWDNELDKRRSWEEALSAGIVTIFSETIDILDYLKSKNVNLALLSRSSPEYTNQKISHFGLEKYFTYKKTVDVKTSSKTQGALDLVRMFNDALPCNVYCIGDRLEDVTISDDIRKHFSLFRSFGIFVDRNGDSVNASHNYHKVKSLKEVPNVIGV